MSLLYIHRFYTWQKAKHQCQSHKRTRLYRAANTPQVSSEPCAAATHGDGLMAEGSAFNKPKPKPRSLHKIPQGKRTSGIITDDHLFLCKALKLHETRLINALLYRSHLSVPKVVKIAGQNQSCITHYVIFLSLYKPPHHVSFLVEFCITDPEEGLSIRSKRRKIE